MSQDVEIRPSATAVVVRDGDAGLEVLLLRRHEQLKVGGGHWVFPGGTVDPEDWHDADNNEAEALRLAAVRETEEECGLHLSVDELQFISHWTTPGNFGRRYATAFYLCKGGWEPVQVDGEEMDAYRWGAPADLIVEHRTGQLKMMPPTVVTLSELARCTTVDEARHLYASRDVPFIKPLVTEYLGTLCMLYGGDAGYEESNPALPGPRNRCFLEEGVWRYEFLAP
ncbi:MAG: NUDIX hydrolase [Spongiibacter sp.]